MVVPVPDQLEYISDADGTTTDFPYPTRFLQKDEIVVVLRDADGIDTPQYLNQHFTIAGSSWPNGGLVSFYNAPPHGMKVIRSRQTQAKQTVDLGNKQRNDAEAVELQLDRLTMAIQDRGQLMASMQSGLRDEVEARVNADKALHDKVDQEIIDREDADKALASLIGDIGSGDAPLFDTVTAVSLASIEPLVNAIRTAGLLAVGDGGEALYKRVETEPAHAAKVQSADGTWWEIIVGDCVRPEVFGAISDGVFDSSNAIQAAINYAAAKSLKVCLSRSYNVTTDMRVPSNSYIFGGGKLIRTGIQGSVFLLNSVNNVVIDGVGIEDLLNRQDCWNYYILKCSDITIKNYTIRKSSRGWSIFAEGVRLRFLNGDINARNSTQWGDGIHVVGGVDIIIDNLIANTQDDCLSFFHHPDVYGTQTAIENVLVSNCVLTSRDWSAIKIGCDARGSANFTYGDMTFVNVVSDNNVVIGDDRASAVQSNMGYKFSSCSLLSINVTCKVAGVHGFIDITNTVIKNRINTPRAPRAFKGLSLSSSRIGNPATPYGGTLVELHADEVRVNSCSIKGTGINTGSCLDVSADHAVLSSSRIASSQFYNAVAINTQGGTSITSGCDIEGHGTRGIEITAKNVVYNSTFSLGFTTAISFVPDVQRSDIKLTGLGAPTISAPNGSMYVRTDGGVGNTLYIREGAAWVAK